MEIIVDHRERELSRRLACQVTPMPLGDIRIGDLLLERKTGADMAASIIDGRWRDQKARLLASPYTCMYIIEGSLKHHRIPYSTLISALGNTVLRDHMHVWRTRDMDETVDVIRMLANKWSKPLKTAGVCKIVRGENTYVRMLMCIPGVSEHIARHVQKHYSTLKKLRYALRKDRQAVEELRPHTRRLGPNLAQRMYDTFYK